MAKVVDSLPLRMALTVAHLDARRSHQGRAPLACGIFKSVLADSR